VSGCVVGGGGFVGWGVAVWGGGGAWGVAAGGGVGTGGYVDHSSPSSSEVMNGCTYTATIPVCCSGMDKNDFTFLGAFA